MKQFVVAALIFTALASCSKKETTNETPAVVHDTVTAPAGGLSDSTKTEAVEVNAADSSTPTDTTAASGQSPVNNPNIKK